MSLPTDSDYQSAIQASRQAFSDPELRGGQVELVSPALPLPKARAGNFATVYRMQCGPRSYAVRCFTRAIQSDLQSRYEAIAAHLEASNLPYWVHFKFLSQGIRVGQSWFPILKMEWIQGESLGAFVEKNVRNSRVLRELAHAWLEMMNALQQAGIAHGDLQHANVLIVGRGLRLIDYDGMYVPALAGRRSHETGHRHYQHPLRDAAVFGPHLDNFSGWVVLLSLLALAHKPDLWTRFKGGDDCLLFRREDFVAPEHSKILAELLSSREPTVHAMATLFRRVLAMAPAKVPALDGSLLSQPAVAPAPIPDWLSDHLRKAPAPVPHPSPRPASDGRGPGGAANRSWILDFIQPAPAVPLGFQSSPAFERWLAAGSLLLALLLAFAAVTAPRLISALWLLPLTGAVNAAAWAVRYRRDPGLKERHQVLAKLETVEREMAAAERRRRDIEQQQKRIREEDARRQAELAQEQARIKAREAQECHGPRQTYRTALTRIAKQRVEADQREQEGLAALHRGRGSKLARLNQQLTTLAQAESKELSDALSSLQNQHLAGALQRATVDGADIPGVGAALKSKLMQHGFKTAADIQILRIQAIRGIGPVKAQAIENWRKIIEIQARLSCPSRLPQQMETAIQERYRVQRAPLESERDREQRMLADETRDLQEQLQKVRALLQMQEKEADNRLLQEEGAVVARLAPEYVRITAEWEKLAAETKTKLAALATESDENQRALFSLEWRKEATLRALEAFDSLRFGAYLRRILPS